MRKQTVASLFLLHSRRKYTDSDRKSPSKLKSLSLSSSKHSSSSQRLFYSVWKEEMFILEYQVCSSCRAVIAVENNLSLLLLAFDYERIE
ncbi:hypothetical protein RB195_015916 [Necator americanus]|uniref:Uncharacterized protein n=1 Tax=Necator americanus TaxID=51031 RepID=A0ABR1E6T6_NECAM